MNRACWTILLWSLFLVKPTLAGVVGRSVPIENRFESADIVCVGTARVAKQINSFSSADGKLKPADYELFVDVEKFYKGAQSGKRLIITFTRLDPAGGPPARPNQTYLFFLQKAPGTTIVPIQNEGAMIPTSLAVDPGHAYDGINGLQEDFANDIDKPLTPDKNVLEQLSILSQFSSITDQTSRKLDQLALVKSPEIAVLALSTLVQAGSQGELYVSKLIAKLKDHPDVDLPYDEQLAHIVETRSSSEDLNNLEAIAMETNKSLKLSAMLAIRRFQISGSVKFLLTMLDSSDRQVQYQAVITLAELTKTYGDYAPAMSSFDSNPGKYISLWKRWDVESGNHL